MRASDHERGLVVTAEEWALAASVFCVPFEAFLSAAREEHSGCRQETFGAKTAGGWPKPVAPTKTTTAAARMDA
jgi:hypothetical protein